MCTSTGSGVSEAEKTSEGADSTWVFGDTNPSLERCIDNESPCPQPSTHHCLAPHFHEHGMTAESLCHGPTLMPTLL